MLKRFFNRRPAHETRASYTDAQVNAAYAAAVGSNADVAMVAAAEFGIGLISRAFLVCDVFPPLDAVSGPVLAQVARSLLLRGNAVYGVKVDAEGRVKLSPAVSWDVRGGGRRIHVGFTICTAPGPRGTPRCGCHRPL